LRKKVAIVGFTEHKRLAPYEDDSWDIWGLNDLGLDLPTHVALDRLTWFQIHTWHDTKEWNDDHVNSNPLDLRGGPPHGRDPNHVAWLIQTSEQIPLYFLEPRPEVPDAKIIDQEAMFKFFSMDGEKPCNYFTNTISWMLGKAIMDGYEEIGVWGVDMMMGGSQENSEYGYQRPSCEWLLGWARALGIRVHLPEQSDLLKTSFVYGDRDGNLYRMRIDGYRKELTTRAANLREQAANINNGITEIAGALNLLNWQMQSWMPGDGPMNPGRSPEPHAQKLAKGTITDALKASGEPSEKTAVNNRLDKLEGFAGDVGHFLEGRFGPDAKEADVNGSKPELVTE